MINKVIITKFLYFGSVALVWPHNIRSRMLCDILTGKVEIFCYLLELSDVSRSIENRPIYIYFFLDNCFGLLVFLGLLNDLLFIYRLR